MDINKKYRVHGAVAALLFLSVVITLLLLLAFTTQLPLPGEEGVEVNLGYADMGRGKEQPLKNSSQQATPPPQKQMVEPVEEEIVTQETEEAPVIESKEEPPVEEVKEVIEETPDPEPVKDEPKVNPAALYKGKSDNANNSQSEGITGDEGDQGNEKGTPDAKSYDGTGGMGDGMSHDLQGRVPKFLPKPPNTFSEYGTVVVQITVNKYGKVVKAIAIDKGSNTTDAKLRKLAQEAALKAVFNARSDAPELQRGTITYHFRPKR